MKYILKFQQGKVINLPEIEVIGKMGKYARPKAIQSTGIPINFPIRNITPIDNPDVNQIVKKVINQTNTAPEVEIIGKRGEHSRPKAIQSKGIDIPINLPAIAKIENPLPVKRSIEPPTRITSEISRLTPKEITNLPIEKEQLDISKIKNKRIKSEEKSDYTKIGNLLRSIFQKEPKTPLVEFQTKVLPTYNSPVNINGVNTTPIREIAENNPLREKISNFKDLPRDVIRELIPALQNEKFKTFKNKKGKPGRINIISKEENKKYLFDRDFNLIDSWPILRGAIYGDHLNTSDPDSPSKRGSTTMAGHGVWGKPKLDASIWREYHTSFTPLIYNKWGDTGIGDHGTYEGEFADRQKRLYSNEPANRLISYGCINNPRCKLEQYPNEEGDSVFITKDSQLIKDKLAYIAKNKLKVGQVVPPDFMQKMLPDYVTYSQNFK